MGDELPRDASEVRLRALVELAPDGIFVTREGTIVYANPAGARLLGASHPGEVAGRPLSKLLSAPQLEVARARLAAAHDDQLLPVRVYDLVSADGKTVTVEATSLAMQWEGAPATLTFTHDIGERLEMAARLARADRLAALGALAAGVAHEINSPLAFVTLAVDSLHQLSETMPAKEKAEARAMLVDMRGGLERVATITRDLRTFAREREEEPTTPAEVSAVLGAAARLVAHVMKHRARLVMDVPAKLPRVRCGALRLEQVFVNLLLNAAQSFDPEATGGVVTVRALDGGDRVTVEVTDDGPGMAPEVVARVFEPFFTTKGTGDGTGLGLAISQTIVTAAEGTLSVKSALGRGTTFRVELPAVIEQEAPAAAAAPRRRARVLIIDDEVAIIRSLGALLETDYDVVMMTSGREAMDTLLGGATYDVVLCDLMMPNVTGMDIYEKLEQARPGEQAKLVFMTGGAFTERARAFLAGITNACVEKPFPISELDAIIAKLIA